MSSGDLSHYHSDVVSAAAMVCRSDHLAADDAWVLVVVEDGLDVLVLDLAPEPIGAE